MYFISFSLEKFSLLSLILIVLLPLFLCGMDRKKGKNVEAEHSLGLGKRETFKPLECLQDPFVRAQVEAGAPHWA